jgi:hypothetical protein
MFKISWGDISLQEFLLTKEYEDIPTVCRRKGGISWPTKKTLKSISGKSGQG